MQQNITIAVIGLGAMGLGIAQVFAKAGYQVIATDQFEAARQTAKDRMIAGMQPLVDKGKMSELDVTSITEKVTILDDLNAFKPYKTTLVIEAIAEDLQIKQSVFKELELVTPDTCIFATNTSSLSVVEIASGLINSNRLIGLHFFNPAPVMKLVEFITQENQPEEIKGRITSLMQPTGKTVVACKDLPGFIVNRCARPFYGEALAMLEEGIPAKKIDAQIMSMGFRLGPFGLIDLVGADINLAATESLYTASDKNPRYFVFDALRKNVSAGKLGRKSEAGFIYPDRVQAAPQKNHEIERRMIACLVNEAAWLSYESDLLSDDIDLALKLGLNFPFGPFELASTLGYERIAETLENLETSAPSHLKGRYNICPILSDLLA